MTGSGRRLTGRGPVAAALAAAMLAASVAGCTRANGGGDPGASTAASTADGATTPGTDGFRAPEAPVVQKPGLDNATLAPAGGDVAATVKPVTIAVSSVATQTNVRSLKRADGTVVAAVTTYQVPAGSAASERFRTQFLVQILSAAGGGPDPRFVQVGTRTVAESTGQPGAAAWFEGATVHLLTRVPPADTDLDSLVVTALSAPQE